MSEATQPHQWELGKDLILHYAPGGMFDTHKHRWALQSNKSKKLLSVMDTNDTGEINRIETSPRHRRKGYATKLFNVATAYSGHVGLPAPQHSDERTNAGEKWAKAMGAPPAKNLIASRQFGFIWDMPLGDD